MFGLPAPAMEMAALTLPEKRATQRRVAQALGMSVRQQRLYDAYAERSRGAPPDFSTTSLRDLAPSPTGLLVEQQDRRLLLESLQCIPLDMQIVLELAYWEELSGSEIALVLGVPENTVYSRIRRARQRLRQAMLELGAAPEAAREELRAGLTRPSTGQVGLR